jgi:Na+/H+ antiporter NhaC
LAYITPVIAILYAYTGKFIWKEEAGTVTELKSDTANGAK